MNGNGRNELQAAAPISAQQLSLVDKVAQEQDPSFVVGLGASAGGLEALEIFFDPMPTDTGMAFIVVQHLSPDYKSLMDEILRKYTSMPIREAKQGMRVIANHIYVTPPRKILTVLEGHLQLTDSIPPTALHLPIDMFFRSLATAYGPKAIAVIMSGTGTDGSREIHDIKEAGGLVMVQDSQSAKFDGMPSSVRLSGNADVVLAPKEMTDRLMQHKSEGESRLFSLEGRISQTHSYRKTAIPPAAVRDPESPKRLDDLQGTLVEEHIPPGLIIDQNNDVIHLNGAINDYLMLAQGKPSWNLYKMIDPSVSAAVSAAIQKVRQEQRGAVYHSLGINTNSGEKRVDLHIRPFSLKNKAFDKYVLLLFMDPVEKLETSNEELQATNEELVAANEELQSANEELRSVNEELVTINREYQFKIQELTDVNNDMNHFLASTTKLSYAVEQSPSIIVITDVGGSIEYVNPKFTEITGFSLSEVRGSSLRSFCETPAGEQAVDQIMKTATNCGLWKGELTSTKKSGELYRESVKLIPIKDKKGEIIHFVKLSEDISERKQAEEMLRKTEMLSAVGQLAAGIAHEIRNPLTALKGFTKLMSNKGTGNESYIGIMLDELNRIEQIISELLVLAKPQAVDFVQMELEPILHDVILLLESQANMNNVEMSIDLEQGIKVVCVENQLKQVFINVLKNAIEAMPRGGQVNIQASLSGNRRIVVRFTDNGSGIPKSKLAKLGEPFYSTKDKGTGLGLMVSYRIIENHQGSIRFESTEGEGTTVTITIPGVV